MYQFPAASGCSSDSRNCNKKKKTHLQTVFRQVLADCFQNETDCLRREFIRFQNFASTRSNPLAKLFKIDARCIVSSRKRKKKKEKNERIFQMRYKTKTSIVHFLQTSVVLGPAHHVDLQVISAPEHRLPLLHRVPHRPHQDS